MLNPSIAIRRPRCFADLLARIIGSAEPGRRLVALMGWAIAVAVLMSTEFLFQPFIWRNFAPSEILPGWLEIARDRIVVAMTIALLLALVERRSWTGRWRFLPYLLAVVVGAATGEALLSWFTPQEDRQDIVSLMGRILRWSIVGGAIATMVEVWRSGAELAAAAEESRIEEAQARRLAASSQLEMLRRQIEPHFLFNVLATIRRLQETDPQQGQHVLERLLHYMSATLAETTDRRSSLRDEIDLVQAYLDVCASRMTGRLNVITEAPEALMGLSFPPLVLATLAENAIKHGVFPQNGGVITLSARRDGDILEVAVSDDGAGLKSEGGGGMGLANIVERLRLLYGPTASLSLRPNAPRGVRAVIRIPARPA